MFNRSIKYILLLIINIVVLFTLYAHQAPEDTGVFDTQFVIGLLEERDDLQSSVIDLEMAVLELEKAQQQFEDDIISLSSDKTAVNQSLLRCEEKRLSTEGLLKEQAAQLDVVSKPQAAPNCEAQAARLLLARRELASAQVQVEEQKIKLAELEKLIAQTSQTDNAPELIKEIEQLKIENEQLKSDIEDPIYLKSVYLSGRKCEKPQFDELVCIQEFLVRPKFSKAPTSEVAVTIYAPNNEVLAKSSFVSKRAQLYRFPMGRGREVIAGDFRATFEVEGELLETQGHTIVH
ncbi:hypothetical protein ACFO4O_02585 [Glaciecola siphonariae]|uniref:Uncharacterized protein n=1 Tax=Glaciecola siphonariae TaxID=521012 RepID=A0ABV9LTV0_9ALTE